MAFARASGILLHPTSLPGRFGVGDLGKEAYRFADFLVAAGQTLWQVLPLGPSGAGGSPYASFSAFAGNTLLISAERLFEKGLIKRNLLADLPFLPQDAVHFQQAEEIKTRVLAETFENFLRLPDAKFAADFELFAEQNAWWLDDYALYRALKVKYGGGAWSDWPSELARHNPGALARARDELRQGIEAEKLSQFLFFQQWYELKAYCNARGLKIIGDIPMFVAHDSADVWMNADQFKLKADGTPVVVAGVPPDYFSETGQYWGNPIFHWEHMCADGFRWWIDRVRSTFQIVDIARVDHFRGFVACWEIPGDEATAEHGRWVETPGRELFTTMRNELGQLPIIAEDLGVITSEVEKLRDDFGFPGMRVLQFAFSGDAANVHLPDNYPRSVVVYTGTHDNDTAVGWFNRLKAESSTIKSFETESELDLCLKYLNSNGAEINWDLIRVAFASVADMAIVPLQDVLGLGSEARMNVPNTNANNWRWRFRDGALGDKLIERLKALTESHGRSPDAKDTIY